MTGSHALNTQQVLLVGWAKSNAPNESAAVICTWHAPRLLFYVAVSALNRPSSARRRGRKLFIEHRRVVATAVHADVD